jgi:hypothetical protein
MADASSIPVELPDYKRDDNPSSLMYKGAAISNPARGAYARLTYIRT